jgi:hypothetical protein
MVPGCRGRRRRRRRCRRDRPSAERRAPRWRGRRRPTSPLPLPLPGRSCRRRGSPDAVLAAVGDVDRAGRVHRERRGEVEPGLPRRAAVTREVGSSRRVRIGAGDRRDRRVGGPDHAHPAVAGVGDEQIARCVDRQPRGHVQLRLACRPAVTGEAGVAESRNDGLLSGGGVHPVDEMPLLVGDVDERSVHGQRIR